MPMLMMGVGGAAVVAAVTGITWSTADATAGSFTLSDSNTTAAATLTNFKTIRGSSAKSTGLWYVEFKCTSSASQDDVYQLGFGSAGISISLGLNEAGNYSCGFSTAGSFSSAGFSAGSGGTVSGTPVTNDIMQLAINFTSQKLWVGKNNTWIASGDPAAGTNPAFNFTVATTGALYPAMSMYYTLAGIWRIQGEGNQTYSPPSGFSAWSA